MRGATVCVAAGVASSVLAACTADANLGPFEGLPLDGDFLVGTTAPVHVARDTAGVAHIAASSIGDAAFVQGYVMAHDRLPQMDVLRRFGAGTLAELYGVMDPAVIDSDLEMRMYRLGPRAQASWDALHVAGDAADQRVVALLERFAAGVNAYADELQRGTWQLDPAIAASWDPAQLVAWSPVDSLVIIELDAFAQWWSAPFELDATELYQGLRQTYDLATDLPAASARRGLSRDLLRLAPIGRAPTIDGFPNVASDTGSRSDGSEADERAQATRDQPAPVRPVVPHELLDGARTLFGRGAHTGALGALGPQALFYGDGGSATAVASQGGRVLLAGDPRAPLSYPSMFYPTHLMVTAGDDPIDLLGVTLPGVPGILLGSNGHVAWSVTTSHHDVNDLYLEQIAPCPEGSGGSCVAWIDPAGAPRAVPIETFSADIQIGALGVIRATTHATYETTPHHGVLLPVLDRARHTITPRTGSAALAVRMPDDAMAIELRALDNLARATTVADGMRALADAAASGRSWTLIDRDQHLGWTSHAALPIRKPAAYVWDPLTHQDALAPFFVLPGDGSGDWLDRALSTRFVPHAIDPPQGYLVAGSGDPVGATFDGLPLDQGVVDDNPLYAGVNYGDGLHAAQITAALQARATEPGQRIDLTVAELAAVQDDPRSRLGAALVPAILEALDRLDEDGPPADVAPYLAALPAADRARLVTARAQLAAWRFATPAGASADAAATAIFHTWLTRFTERTLADELDGIGVPLARLDDNQRARVIHALLTDPRSFITSPASQQPILCDNYAAVGPDDSCTKVILEAMVDAMTVLESPAGFGTADTGAWPWGQLHTLALTSVLPGVAAPTVPLAGDDLAADRAPGSLAADGPALRWTAEADGEAITVKWALPGGVIFDGRSPHARDQLDRAYLSGTYLDAPATVAQIVAAGESRWVFH